MSAAAEPQLAERRTVRVSATEGTKVGPYLRDVWEHRGLLRVLIGRDLKGAHEMNIVGFFWWLLEPLSYAMVYFVLIDVIFGRGTPAFPLFAIIALLPYKWMVRSITGSIGTVNNNAGLVGNVFFPRAFLPLAEVTVGLANYSVGLLIIPGFMLYYRIAPTLDTLWLPVVIAVQYTFLLGIAFPAAAIGIHFKNVRRLTGNLMRLWFYLSPGIWALSEIDDERLRQLIRFNPLTGIFESYHNVIMFGEPPDPFLWYTLGLGLVGLMIGGVFFVRKERQFGKTAI